MAKTAQIYSVRTPDAQGFCWAWRGSDGKQQSPENFVYFYECVEDARRAGYSVVLGGASAKGVDGGEHHGLA